MKVKKRDGVLAEFNTQKIKNAVLKAFAAVDGQLTDYAIDKADNIANYIEGYCMDTQDILSIEDIQDLVENGLMSTRRKDVAKAYITYRQERTKEREKNSKYVQNIENKIEVVDNQRQNANVDEESFGGRMGEASSANLKEYALNYCMPRWMADLHINNEIYIHDLDHYALGDHNCLSIPFDDLLANGFNTRQTDVRPANSVNTAFQLVAVIFQLQSLNQFGGVSATHLDWTMVPYVRKSFYKHFKNGLTYIEKISFEEDNYNSEILDTALKDMTRGYLINSSKRIITEKNEYYYDNIPIDKCNGLEYCAYHDYPLAYQYALDMTRKEVYQAVEGMYHNLNTLQSRSGN